MPKLQLVFSIAFAVIFGLVAGFSAYVALSAIWADRWNYRSREGRA